MAETTLTLPQQTTTSADEVKIITYWGAVRAKLWRDKITMFAFLLGLFMITITLAAPWIAEHVTGFDPLDTDLRNRNAAPTWAEEAWPKFEDFTRACQSGGCDWTLWPAILSDAATGLSDCFTAGLIAALLRDWDMVRILEFGSAVGAIGATALGCTDGVPSFEEVERFLKENKVDICINP